LRPEHFDRGQQSFGDTPQYPGARDTFSTGFLSPSLRAIAQHHRRDNRLLLVQASEYHCRDPLAVRWDGGNSRGSRYLAYWIRAVKARDRGRRSGCIQARTTARLRLLLNAVAAGRPPSFLGILWIR